MPMLKGLRPVLYSCTAFCREKYRAKEVPCQSKKSRSGIDGAALHFFTVGDIMPRRQNHERPHRGERIWFSTNGM